MPDADTVPAGTDELAAAGVQPEPPAEPPLRPAAPDEAARWGVLPPAFVERVRALPHSTMVGIPFAFRAQLCEITASLLEGMNADHTTSGALEEARSKSRSS